MNWFGRICIIFQICLNPIKGYELEVWFYNTKYEWVLILMFWLISEIAGRNAKTVPVSQGPACSYCEPMISITYFSVKSVSLWQAKISISKPKWDNVVVYSTPDIMYWKYAYLQMCSVKLGVKVPAMQKTEISV